MMFGVFAAYEESLYLQVQKTCLSGEKLAAKSGESHDRNIVVELGKRRASC